MQMLMAGKPPDVDPASARKEWLATLTQSMDAYLRTPAFLEGVRKNSETLSAAKVSADLAQREWAREAGIPHIEDISGLYDRLETAHEVVLEKLSAIEKRLGAMEKKLSVAQPKSPAAKATSKTETTKKKAAGRRK
jgi:hypothetical protein